MRLNLRSVVRAEAFVLFIVVLLGATALSLVSSQFLQTFNIYVLLYNVALSTLVAFGQMVVVATGGMNISLGAIGGLSAVVAAMLMEWHGWPLWLIIPVVLLGGTLMGFINGFLTVKTGISAFVITLAMASAYTGASMAITNANPIYGIYESVRSLGQARIGVFPWPAVATMVVMAGLATWFHRMTSGRQVLALGGNRTAAELTGVPIGRRVIQAHVISGLIASIAGFLTMARVQAGAPTIGNAWLLPGFAAIVIGGVLLEGGKITIVGVLLGVAILELIANALAISHTDPFFVTLLQGALVLVAVILGQARRRMMAKGRVRPLGALPSTEPRAE
ncbi:MAG: ABC transporter permease [Actinobacteria bacterium]|nr:ABC transporter permease [Actinomycetota bacterium]